MSFKHLAISLSLLLSGESKYFIFRLYGSVPSLEMSCFHGWNEYTRLLSVQHCLLSSHCPPIALTLSSHFSILGQAFSKEACCKMPCTSLHKCHSNTISNTCSLHSLLICLERSQCTYLDFYGSVAPFGPLTSLSHGTICTF